MTTPAPSTPVTPPAVDVPLPETDEEIGARLADETQYNEPGTATAVANVPSETGEMADEDKRKAVTKAYAEASTWIREKYREEFDTRIQSQLAQIGIDWTPKPNKEQRARAKAIKVFTDAGLPVPAELQS